MNDLSQVDWAAIRAAYLNEPDSVAALAKRFGVSASAIFRRAKRETWPRRAASKANRSQCPAAREQKPAAAQREALCRPRTLPLAERLRSAIHRQLASLEERMDRTDDLSTADHEREARTLGGLIRNVEKLKVLDEADGAASGKPEASGHDNGSDDAIDQDTFRRDVAERIMRLRERLGHDVN